jgi:phosphohistidine phosphatase
VSGRSHAEVIVVIQPLLDVASLALVGHEPNLSELASILLTGRPTSLTMEMKKGGVAHVWLDDGLRRGTATLRWLVTPKVLRVLSG